MRRNLILAVVAVAVGLGVWLWWQQGGFGGPVSDAAARRYFDRIVAADQAEDFQALCRLNGTVGTCRGELRVYCPEGYGSARRLRSPREQRWTRPSGSPSRPIPPSCCRAGTSPRGNGYVGGRILLVRGTDGRGKPYETEVLIFRDRRTYKAIHAVFWSGEKFEELNPGQGVSPNTSRG